MSDGLKLLSSILTNGSTGTLAGLDRALFLEAELPAFDFIKSFYRQYRELPASAVVTSDTGVRLAAATQGLDYYVDRVEQRQIYNGVRDEFGALRDALSAKDVGGMRAAIRVLNRAANPRRATGEAIDIHDAVDLAIERLYSNRGSGGITGIPSGWEEVDTISGGWQAADLISFAGRMGMGKTYLLLRQAGAAFDAGYSVAFFTTEIQAEAIARRWIALSLGIDPNVLKSAMVSNRMMRRIRDFRQALAESNRFKLIPLGLEATVPKVEQCIEEYGPAAIYLDGAYMLRPSSYKAGMKFTERVGETFGELKGITLDYKLPIICTTAFNRTSGKHGEQASLENLSWSDMIAYYSSIIIALKPGTGEYKMATRVMEFLKGREGESGEIEINYKFTPLDMTVVDLADRHPSPDERGDAPAAGAALDWMAPRPRRQT